MKGSEGGEGRDAREGERGLRLNVESVGGVVRACRFLGAARAISLREFYAFFRLHSVCSLAADFNLADGQGGLSLAEPAAAALLADDGQFRRRCRKMSLVTFIRALTLTCRYRAAEIVRRASTDGAIDRPEERRQ